MSNQNNIMRYIAEEEHERSIVAHTVKRMATAIMEGEKKKNKKPQEKKYPSEILREENLKVIKEKLTAMICKAISWHIL